MELRTRMVDFTVDGVRFGTLLPETKSGSPHDRRLEKKSEEIVTAAFILGRLGYEGVQLITKAHDGTDAAPFCFADLISTARKLPAGY